MNNIKNLNQDATDVFIKIINILGEKESVKIGKKEDAYMPLCVEELPLVSIFGKNFRQISLAHYGEQNGDLMADPEMIFLYNNDNDIVTLFTSYYKNDYVGVEQISISFDDYINGNFSACDFSMQKDHTIFAMMWLKNIQEQQNL